MEETMERNVPKYVQKRYDVLGPRVAAAMQRRGMEARYCATAEEAAAEILRMIPAEHVVSWGGTETVRQMKIVQALKARGQSVIDRDEAKTEQERVEAMRQALLCDTFLMSSNAISENGELVNVDGKGNRLAALLYGPRQVIVAAGMNKVVRTLDDAVNRARFMAAPVNAQRFPVNTPCRMSGMCEDCQSPDCICAHVVVTRFCSPKGRIRVVLVGEDLGF